MSAQRRKTKSPGIYARTKSDGTRVYDIAYWVPKSGGRRKAWESGFASMQEARSRLEEVRVQLRRGTYVTHSNESLGDFVRRRLKQRFTAQAIRPSTYESDLRLLRTHLPRELDAVPIQKLTTADLDRLYASLVVGGRKDGKQGGLSPRTIERLHVLLSSSLKAAIAQGLVQRNVATATTRPPRIKPSMKAMTVEEVSRFLDVAKDDWFFPLYFLELTTGMRRGELCGLTWPNVDLERGEISVRKTLVSVNHQPVWSTAKTNSGDRTISLDLTTINVLQIHRRNLAEARLALGSRWADVDDLVFPKPDGSLYNPESIYMRLSRLLKKAGLEHYSMHELRHTYATLARRRGVDIKVLSERLGHSTVLITMDLYQHVPQDLDRQAANDIANYILGEA